MGFSAFYASAKKTTPDQAKAVIHHAAGSGVTLFNSATFYGELNDVGFGANLRLLRTCIEGLDRSKIQLMVKVGMDTRFVKLSFPCNLQYFALKSSFFQMSCGENWHILGNAR